jgi:hypothetical protein
MTLKYNIPNVMRLIPYLKVTQEFSEVFISGM